MIENDAFYKKVIKYINGKTTHKETAEVSNWINASDENKELFFRIKDISDAVKSKGDITKNPLDVWEEILLKRDLGTDKKETGRARKFPRSYLNYAAVFLILACTVFYIKYAKSKQIITISVAKNQPAKQIQLPDNSVIWLKPGSTVRYAADFNETTRVVNLNGDGFFEVAKVTDDQGHRKPFTVQTSKMSIRVMGTSFNVKNEDGRYNVVVRTGVVHVVSGAKVKVLHPGDRVKLIGTQLLSDKVNPDLYMGWATGEYKFNNTSVEEIKELLQTNYNCDVEILQAEKFKSTHLSGRVMAHDEATLLNMLSIMLPASIHIHNNIITIKPQ